MSAIDEKGLPCNLDTERYVLGSILMNSTTPGAQEAIDFLHPSDFSTEANRRILVAVRLLNDQGTTVDRVTVGEQLRRRSELELIGGLSYLCELDTGIPQLAQLKSWTRILREKASLRQVIFTSQKIMNRAVLEQGAATEIAAEAGELMENISQNGYGDSAPDPYLLEDFERDLLRSPAGLQTGYNQLDCFLRIPQGAITIVAGRPGHGKTTMLLNLLLNLLDRYPEKRFFFFSYEEARCWLALKVIMISGGEILDREHNFGWHLSYMKERGRSVVKNQAIEKALQRYGELSSSGRLTIVDERLSAEDLAAMIGFLSKKYDVGGVIVDYMQKVPVRNTCPTRYLDIKRASELILEQAVLHNLPIVLGAQLGRSNGSHGKAKVRLDNLRECGDIEQDAALVLGVYNESADRTEDDGEVDHNPDVEFEVNVLKNRSGWQGKHAKLIFHRPTLKISDTPHLEATASNEAEPAHAF